MSCAHGASSAQSAGDFAIKKRVGQILSCFSLEGKTVLDIGCGNGLYTLRLAELAEKVMGIDIAEEAIAEARRNNIELKGSVEFLRASAESLPFCDCSFYAVLAIEMLEHVPDQERALKEASRALKDNGYLIVYVPNKLYPFEVHGLRIGNRHISGLCSGSVPFFSWAPSFVRKKFERARIYTKGEITKVIERNGFVVREIDYYYPPLDRINSKLIKALLRRVLAYLERNPLTRKFGMSIFVLVQKR